MCVHIYIWNHSLYYDEVLQKFMNFTIEKSLIVSQMHWEDNVMIIKDNTLPKNKVQDTVLEQVNNW